LKQALDVGKEVPNGGGETAIGRMVGLRIEH